MYLSRLELDPTNPLVRRDLSNCHELHRTLLRAFPDVETGEVGARAALGVLFRLEHQGPTPLVYVQSDPQPAWEKLPDGYLRDRSCRTGGNPAVRPLEESYRSLQVGQRLRFRLLANPTKKVGTATMPDGRKRNGRRIPLAGDEQRLAWLERKASAGGFALLRSRIASSQADVRESRVRRHRGRKKDNLLTFEGVMFEGHLEIVDAERFRETLKKGVGSGKAYGFGLVSLAPA